MRVFDVFVQEEKVICELDIYSVVGANRPLQLVDIRVSVGEDGSIVTRFEGIHGSPIISAICIRRAPELLESQVEHGYLICNNCAAEIEVTSAQNKLIRTKYMAKYEKKIEELSTKCHIKTKECYEAWMSLTAANEQLENTRTELDSKFFQYYSLDQAMEKQTAQLRYVSSRYAQDKKHWSAAINDLERKIKNLKQDHSQLSQEAHKSADSTPQLNKMACAVQALVSQCDEFKLKYCEEQAMRKKLYNEVLEAKGNIRVFCRCRPLSREEVSAGQAAAIDFAAANDGDIGVLTGGSTKKIFKLDRVYMPKDNQIDVFEDASPLVISVLDGYNVCIFAYGQTGTGKTFTMEGTEQNRGVNYKTLEHIFRTSNQRKESFAYNISVSVLEVYNEQIRDLLAASPTSKKLEIRQASEGVHHVPGIVEAKVENIREVWDVLQTGSNARAVGSNNVNEHSSRSHCMLCIKVEAKNLINGECTKSKLWLVDLAGSERLAKTEVQGERLKEAQNINRSLSALGDVISALATKNSHIPYRNSKLTHLLQDSLGGDSKALMFVQISPLERDLCETLSSLTFATRVRGVELGPAKKQIETGEIQKLRMMLDKAKQESKSKDDALHKLEENCHNLDGKAKGKVRICRNQQEKINELEHQLGCKTRLCRQLEQQLLQLLEQVRVKEEISMALQEKVKIVGDKPKKHGNEEVMTLQHKVNELENKLKERGQEFEFQAVILKQKVKDLESKLKMQGDNQGADNLLHRKIKELEEKLRQEKHMEKNPPRLCSAEKLSTTPHEGKTWRRVETVSSVEPPNPRSINSSGHSLSQGSALLKGTDSLRELGRKRELQSRGMENNFLLSASRAVKVILPAESHKTKHIDPSKAYARVTRMQKPANTALRPFSNNRINKEPVLHSVKDNKSRFWSR
ncbi:kinesin-like protein KIN-14R isoform X2 [Malania oleifera]|nr:kinesin-like protein KIN-14R isoform X2 [Malania oleifera]